MTVETVRGSVAPACEEVMGALPARSSTGTLSSSLTEEAHADSSAAMPIAVIELRKCRIDFSFGVSVWLSGVIIDVERRRPTVIS